MKKTISKILVLLFVFALSVTCIASCTVIGDLTHTHEYVDGMCQCGAKDPDYVAPHTHTFVDGVCECGESDPDYVPPHTHNYTSEQTTAPTCTEKGVNTLTCACGDSYTEPVDANGHSYTDGLCSVCGAKDPSVPIIVVLALSADKTQAVVGEEITLTAILKTADSDVELTDLVYTIVDGEGKATVEGNVITIAEGAVDGDVITVQTTHDGITSNLVTVTVIPDTTVNSIYAYVNSDSQNVMKGSTVSLISVVDPDGIASSFVQWKIISGNEEGEIASINGNSLTISANAPTGAVIKVVAYFGEVESNELEITVAATQEEINAGKYFLTVSDNELTVDKNGATAPMIKVNILNYNFEKVTDIDLEYVVIAGDASLISLTPNGNTCSIAALGHGTVTVQVGIPNTNIFETITVTSIVPPTAVTLPEVFAQRPMAYQFSYRDALPFVAGIKGENVCTDVIYTFAHEDGTVGDEVAVYNEDGTITFKKLGKVTVTATSNSGSRVEAKASYTFNINNGYNIYSFAELDYLVQLSGQYNGQQLNLVVLEKPVDPDGNYEYGYDMVPPAALLPDAEQDVFTTIRGAVVDSIVNRLTNTVVSNIKIDSRIQAVNSNLWLNGNNHCINASQLRIYNIEEANDFRAQEGSDSAVYNNVSSLLTAEPWSQVGESGNGDPALDGKTFSVKLYDIVLKGNAGVNYDPADYNGNNTKSYEVIGAVHTGLSIGHFGYNVHYYIDANNLTSSGFGNGMSFTEIVGNGTIANLYAYDCYSTGILSRANIVTLHNLKFGPCGATGIELTPDRCGNAGLGGNENQQITITGTINVEQNLNAGDSVYFQRYLVKGLATVPSVIDGNIAQYDAICPTWISHLQNESKQFSFVSLIFEDFDKLNGSPENPTNTSIVNYPNYQEGGIIDITSLPTDGSYDTTHQFIRMPIHAIIPGAGTVFAGFALFYNMHYTPASAQ